MPDISEPCPTEPTENIAPVSLPRITIKFCTQCKWMLRAAYFAQELLSTFSTSLGEVSLIPSTGGVFTVDIIYAPSPPADETSKSGAAEVRTQTRRLWDRKTEGGFPETKLLKKLVRDIIDPTRDLGHVDGKKNSVPPRTTANGVVDVEAGREGGSTGLQGDKGGEGERGGDGKGEGKGEGVGGIKRNPDGAICEECS